MAHDISCKAAAYGIQSCEIDGMDVLNVYDAMKPLVDEVRASSKPAFVDMRTYRYKGHSMSDPRKYRTREEEQVYEEGDPIAKMRDFLLERGYIDDDAFKMLGAEVKQEVRDSVAWADASPVPDPEKELHHDVFVSEFGPYTGTSLPEMLQETQEDEKGDE